MKPGRFLGYFATKNWETAELFTNSMPKFHSSSASPVVLATFKRAPVLRLCLFFSGNWYVSVQRGGTAALHNRKQDPRAKSVDKKSHHLG